jgi:hypothetical protein
VPVIVAVNDAAVDFVIVREPIVIGCPSSTLSSPIAGSVAVVTSLNAAECDQSRVSPCALIVTCHGRHS